MRRGYAIATGAILAGAAAAGQPGAAAEADGSSGNVELRYGIWESDRSLDDLRNVNAGALAVRAQSALSPQARLRLDAFAGVERAPGSNTVDESNVREAMIVQEAGRQVELRLGWQTFAWGRADRVNPTDVLTPRNYRLLVPQDEEQQIATPALSANFGLTESSRLTGIVQRYARSRLPSDDREPGLPEIARGPLAEWALKLDRTGEGVDWSLSYFNGLEKSRVLALADCTGALPAARREHAAIQMLGADMATTVQGYGIRAEWARIRVREGEASACGGRSGYDFAVIGADRNLPGDATVGVQWFAKRYDDELAASATLAPALRAQLAQFQAVNGQSLSVQTGVTLRYAQRLWNDRLDGEAVYVRNLRTRDYAVRPRVTYRVSDRVRVAAGADEFRGDAATPLGLIKRNSGAFIELHVDLL